jgi:opacity protein-like surface antigen
MLLPVRDSGDGAMAFSVFQEVETYLKESEWCVYRSNSEIINLLSGHKKNLDNYLESPEVLKIIAEKTSAGSLIAIKVFNNINGTSVDLMVIGDNGEDIYLKEKTDLKTDEIQVVAQTIKNWLDVYEKNIPYNARVTGVLGNQFTVDFGSNQGSKEGDEVIVTRPVKKTRHPLLKEIVDWETERIGKGKIFHVAKDQSQGNIIAYDTSKKLKIEDWVTVDKKTREDTGTPQRYEEDSENQFGKLGTVSLFFGLGKASATSELTGTKKVGGLNLGMDLDAVVWMTRQYWGGITLGRHFSSMKKEEGVVQSSSNSLTASSFSLKAGYKWLPMGFFYGPQLDGYIGYASYAYDIDKQAADGFGSVEWSGILMGFKGSVPIQNQVRINAGLSFIFNPGYTEDSLLFGEDDSASSYKLELGGSFLHSTNMTFDGGYEVTSSKAKFVAPDRSIKVKESLFKVGATFTF